MTIDGHFISELSNDQEQTLEKNLVWIFGSPRSGTTWLGKNLLSYNTHTFLEPYIGAHVAFPGILHNIPKIMLAHRNRENYFFCNKYQNTWKFYLRKLILNRIYAQFQDLSRKIIIKEPSGTHGADILVTCLPMSKVIILIRDGRDVVDSGIDAMKEGSWRSKMTGSVEITSKQIRIRNLATAWKVRIELLNKLFDNYPKELRLRLKYEDLLKNTFDELQKIFKFIDVSISSEDLKKLIEKYKFENVAQSTKGSGKPIRFAKPGLWKDNFTEEEKNILSDIIGDTLKRGGYH